MPPPTIADVGGFTSVAGSSAGAGAPSAASSRRASGAIRILLSPDRRVAVEPDRDLLDPRAEARELDEQLRLAREAALADQRRRRSGRSRRGGSPRGTRGRTTRPCVRPARARAGPRRRRRTLSSAAQSAHVHHAAPAVHRGEHEVGAARPHAGASSGSASRSLVVSASSVTMRASVGHGTSSAR